MKIHIASILFLLISLAQFSNAQFLTIEAMEDTLKSPIPDTLKVKILHDLARDLVYVNPDRAMNLAKDSEQLAISLNRKGDQAHALRIQSAVYSSQNLYSLAAELGLKALAIFQELGDAEGIANYRISMGNMYRAQKLYAKSAEEHGRAYQYFSKNGPEYRLAVVALNYGDALFHVDSLKKAITLLRQSIVINYRVDNKAAQTFSYKSMGKIYLKRQQLDSAEFFFKNSIALSLILGQNSQKEATLESMLSLTELYKMQGEYNNQLVTLIQAEEYAKRYNRYAELPDIYFEMMEYYLNRNNLPRAIEYLEQYNYLQDSLTEALQKDREQMVNTLYNTIKVELDNQLLEEQQRYSEKVIREQRIFIVVVAILAIIALAALIVARLGAVKLKKINKLLNEQTNQIKQKSEELEELNTTKDKIFSIISHDLRSPLHSLISFSDLMSKHYKELSSEEVENMMMQLRNNVDATLKMTENLIQWGKLQMEQAQISPLQFDVSEVIEELYAVYKANAKNKDISFKLSLQSCMVFADKDHVELILRNLINNALKFTSSQGEVKVSCYPEGTNTIVEITDNGQGINTQMIENLFNLKVGSTQGTSGEKGSGLGLMLCYEYAAKNNGKIMVESEMNKGSIFKLLLPQNPPSSIN